MSKFVIGTLVMIGLFVFLIILIIPVALMGATGNVLWVFLYAPIGGAGYALYASRTDTDESL